MLNVFATWCVGCREEMPVLDAAHGTDVTILGIDLREDAGRVRDLIDDTGVRYPILLDWDGAVSRANNAIGLPMTCVVASDGTIRQWIVGPVSPESRGDGIASAGG